MPILVYNKDKIYNPQAQCNVLRRAMKKQIRLKYVKRPICIPALNMLLRIPGMKFLYKLTMMSGITVLKLLANKEQREFLNIKEETLLLK